MYKFKDRVSFVVKPRDDRKEKEIGLGEDFYSLAYASFIPAMCKRYSIKADERENFFQTSVVIFSLQVILSVLVFAQLFNSDFELTMSSYEVFITRFICSILLHISIEKEVN